MCMYVCSILWGMFFAFSNFSFAIAKSNITNFALISLYFRSDKIGIITSFTQQTIGSFPWKPHCEFLRISSASFDNGLGRLSISIIGGQSRILMQVARLSAHVFSAKVNAIIATSFEPCLNIFRILFYLRISKRHFF